MDYIDGKAILENYSISIGELVKAILDGLPAYDAVTGKRVIDQDMMIACPKYETEEQAAKAVDYVDNMLAATRMSQGMPPFRDYSHSNAGYIDAVVRKNKIQGFLKNCKSYKFPEGYDRPQESCGVFPLRYDTFHREYADVVHFKMHGDNETVIGLYQKLIGAMRLPVAAVEERFRKASSASGLDIRHVPLTPGQDWLGNADPLLNLKQIARPISVFDLLSRWSGASGESMGALSERLVRFIKHGALHLFEPQEKGARVLYGLSTIDAAAIEIDCAVASLDGWTEGSQAANDLSGLFADMAEVEALEAQYDSLKPIASDNSGQAPAQAAPLARVEAETEAKPAEVRQQRLRVTQKVAAVLCGVTEKQVGKWDKGVQRPDRYPGRHDLAVLTAWAETYKQGKLVASAARAANHPSTAKGWMLENLSDDGSGDPAAVFEEHEQNRNRKRKL